MIASTGVAKAGELFVSPVGDNDNSGSRENPLKSIAYAVEESLPGDTVRILEGTFSDRVILYQQSGEPEKPILILGDSEDPALWPVFDRGIEPTASGDGEAFRLTLCDWIRIERLRFVNCWPNVIELNGCSYFSLANCEIIGGENAVYATSVNTHHLLIEDCTWEQDERVWTGFSLDPSWTSEASDPSSEAYGDDWYEMHHGSLAYYNGSLLKLEDTAGSFVIRGCTVMNVFNGFRTDFASAANENAVNGEVTGNLFMNHDDNAIEPEGFAWNLHISRNHFHNIHKCYSFDEIAGGRLYVWGNVHTETTDALAVEEVSGIWKFKGTSSVYLTEPCNVFNNSFWTEAQAFKDGEATNRIMKHFNNAYYFFDGSNRMNLTDWRDTFEFDYDAINQGWPANISSRPEQEANGLPSTENMFVDGGNADFRMTGTSPLIDAGKVMAFPELNWSQKYEGTAPDIGAYEGESPVDGPPFRFQEPPGGAECGERTRIVRHSVEGSSLVLELSAALDPSSIMDVEASIILESGDSATASLALDAEALTLTLTANDPFTSDVLKIRLEPLPRGANGESMTSWASTIPLNGLPAPLSSVTEGVTPQPGTPFVMIAYPNPVNGRTSLRVVNGSRANVQVMDRFKKAELVIYDLLGREVARLNPYSSSSVSIAYSFDASELPSGRYFAAINISDVHLVKPLTVLK